MKYSWFAGVDVSKLSLDITIYHESEKLLYVQIENNPKGIKAFLARLARNEGIDLKKCLFCMEHTGIYNANMLAVMKERDLPVCVESSVHIKQSGGLQRGKNDKIDSNRIALFAYKNRDFLKLWEPERAVVIQLRRFSTVRERLINAKKQLSVALVDDKKFTDKALSKQITNCCQHSIHALEKDIKRTEEQIDALIATDEQIKQLYHIIESIPGVGRITATEIVINTNEFKRISDPRKYACYAGIAPFEHSSGTSVRGKTRVSKKANLKAKSLLHMTSLVSVRFCKDLKSYYQRKVSEGKNKMSVLNAVKNKIIHRIFACVGQNRMYQKDYNFSLVES
jgi:transposase